MSKDSRVVKGAGLKTQCVRFVGSNPTPCTFLIFFNEYQKSLNTSRYHKVSIINNP